MKNFKVTQNDLIEFNYWIKGKNVEPRLRREFNTDSDYEDFMINYQDSHITLDNDPAVLANQKQYSDVNLTNIVDCDWEDGIYNGEYDDFTFFMDDKVINFPTSDYGDDEFPAQVEVMNGKAYLTKLDDMNFSEPREKVSAADLKKAKEEGVVQKKPNGKWGIISIKAGEWWIPDYDTKENAENALQAYHANKGFSDNKYMKEAIRLIKLNTTDVSDEDAKIIANFGLGLAAKPQDFIDVLKETLTKKGKKFSKVSNDLPDGIDSKLQDIAQEFNTISYTDIMKFKYNPMKGRRINSLYRSITNALDKDDYGRAKELAELVANVVKNNSRTFSFAEDGYPSIFEIVGMLLYSIADFHIFHLITTDYAAHKALEDYYEGMPELVDAFAEDGLGNLDADAKLESSWFESFKVNRTNPVEYCESMIEFIIQFRKNTPTLGDSQLSELDAIEELIRSTIYKLKRLKIKTFSFA